MTAAHILSSDIANGSALTLALPGDGTSALWRHPIFAPTEDEQTPVLIARRNVKSRALGVAWGCHRNLTGERFSASVWHESQRSPTVA